MARGKIPSCAGPRPCDPPYPHEKYPSPRKLQRRVRVDSARTTWAMVEYWAVCAWPLRAARRRADLGMLRTRRLRARAGCLSLMAHTELERALDPPTRAEQDGAKTGEWNDVHGSLYRDPA